MHLRFSATILAAFVGSALVGCSNPTVTTPTRTLDRPSDIAMYCADIEVLNCLPDLNPEVDPEAYLASYCDQSRIDYANNTHPWVTVLTLDECDQDHRSQRNNDYLKDVYKAARLTARDPNAPCCPPDNTTCGQPAPVCSRRMLAGLVANTSRGELAVADTESQAAGLPTRGRFENLHGGQPGFGFLPTGLLPEHVRSYAPASNVGNSGRRESAYSWAVTANSGSCDFSVVRLQDIATMAARPAYCFQQNSWCENRSCDATTCPQRVEAWLPGGKKLQARPTWVEPAPWSGQTARRTALVAYPTCGIVAAIDLGCANRNDKSCDQKADPGRVLDAVGFDSMGKPRIMTPAELSGLDCMADCGGNGGTLMPDPMDIPDGGVPRIGVYPAALGVEEASQRLLIGDSVGDTLTVVDFDGTASDGNRFRGTPRSVRLDFTVLQESLRGGQKGLQTIRVSPRTPAGQFAYITARDSSVHVVDLDRELECETNPEPRYLQAHAGDVTRVLPDELNASNQRRLSCIPVGTGPRAPLAIGPGITLGNGSLPRDSGFVHVDRISCDVSDGSNCAYAPNAIPDIWVSARTSLWVGDFAWLLGGGGAVTAVQMADACPGPSYRACFPDAAALRRIFFLHTRSQNEPDPTSKNLPALDEALMVTPMDRLTNIRRIYSRFEDGSAFGPRTEHDTAGLPVISTRVLGTAVAYAEVQNDPTVKTGRPRLILPALAPYYHLPVDPVCDVALEVQATTKASPDTQLSLSIEPTRRPITVAQFTNPQAISDTVWTMAWEGAMAGLARTTGNLLEGGILTDLNGLYCSRGVENGDKLRLSGCQTDADCFVGQICQREASQGETPGICLTTAQRMACHDISERLLNQPTDDASWLATWRRYYRIVRAEQQVTIDGGDISDRLTLDEIPEPEYAIERESCTKVGDPCVGPITFPGRGSTTPPDYSCSVTDYKDWKTKSGDVLSCVLHCQTNRDCGDGFVCAVSHYDSKPRCMRAPLLDTNTLRACFPDPVHYEVRGGDSFVVRGDRTGAPVLMQRDPADGSCRRPPPGDPSYAASRLLEPRLRLGPRDSLPSSDKQRCSTDLNKDWILHRIPKSDEALRQTSCQNVRPVERTACTSPDTTPPTRTITLPVPLDTAINTIAGSEMPILDRADPKCPSVDPWLRSEYELLSSLKLDDQYGRNQCILTGQSDEDYPTVMDLGDCYNTMAQPNKLCRFPGDHTEALGVRRIHYESPFGNVVMRLPRVLIDPSKPYSDCTDPSSPKCLCSVATRPCPADKQATQNLAVWAVPQDGYSVSFSLFGTLRSYELLAQTAAQDVSSGILSQGLRSATMAPSGVLFIVDEGRTGGLSSLRGQVLRIVGAQVDPIFLLR